MTEKFISSALEANLAQTRYKNIKIHRHHQEFINLSKSHYGIHKRAAECIVEFHHPLSNRKFVVEELREILLTDFWFYEKVEKFEIHYHILLDIYKKLLQESLSHHLKLHCIKTLMEFIDFLVKSKSQFKNLASYTLEILLIASKEHNYSFIVSSRFLKKYLSAAFEEKHLKMKIKTLFVNILSATINYWQQTTDINTWLTKNKTILHENTIRDLLYFDEKYFEQIKTDLSKAKSKQQYFAIPNHDKISDNFQSKTDIMSSFIAKFYYTFYLLQLPGMADNKERIIWNLNKVLKMALKELDNEQHKKFIDDIFELLKKLKEEHGSAVLDIIFTLGKEVIDIDETDEHRLIKYFEKELIEFGFETPGLVYVNKDWQINVNKNHIKNIRVWMELIEYSQAVMEELLSALIVNIKLGGIFISDTDLFQREITKILNSNIAPYYKKVKQLTRTFPVYFNEIGAEGEIRKHTTQVDELSKREDRLIHFLRKQVHTESNNTLIKLTKMIFNFWYDADLQKLKSFLPKDVFNSIDIDNKWFAPVNTLLKEVCAFNKISHFDILEMTRVQIENTINNTPSKNEFDKKRLKNICVLYGLLREKYSFETVNIISILKKYSSINMADVNSFEESLENKNFDSALKMIFRLMNQLKKVILNTEQSEAWESIYHKRHIAVGIPSMYGVYREPKFDALGLTFRLEKIATRLMEKITQNVNLEYITANTLNRIHQVLIYFKEGLKLDGVSDQSFNSNLKMLQYSLTSSSFSLEQYVNIFQFIADGMKRIVNKYFLKAYETPLKTLIPILFGNEMMSNKETVRLINQKSEEFVRDVISAAFLVQPFDNFVSKILNTLNQMLNRFDKEPLQQIMSYNANLAISPFSKTSQEVDNQVFIGSKAYFLKQLYLNGFPVPPGFVVTTEVFRRRKAINAYPPIMDEIDKKIKFQIKRIQKISGHKFGDYKKPLLLSVRSGTAISMPGAMNTFLNVGMNDELTEAFSKQPKMEWTAWDCYRRLLQSWGMSEGINRDEYDKVMIDFKLKYKVDLKAQFTADNMREMVVEYKKINHLHNVKLEQNLFKQIKTALKKVFDSWDAKRAKVYRKHLQIADEWGTAVIIQKMVLGNISDNSGTGVVFTQDPKIDKYGVNLYGDFSLRSQGEDIVGGLVNVMPISKEQRKRYKLDVESLQEIFPEIYKKIHDISYDMTRNHGFGPQEIEFTFEDSNPKKLFILQTRDLDIKQNEEAFIFSSPTNEMELLGNGIGIGGSAFNGRIAFDMEDLRYLLKKYPDENRILVRPDTVPDDIGIIIESEGLLTAKGGATSHSAVTATRLGKVCVVNCQELMVDDIKKECTLGGKTLKMGQKLAIDGYLGTVFKGNYPLEEMELRRSI